MTKRANYKCALEGVSSDLFGEYLYSLIAANMQKFANKFYSIVSEQDKDDLIQDIWIQMQDKKGLCDDDKSFKGWVYICCRNHFYSFARKRIKKLARERDIDLAWGTCDSGLSPDRYVISKEVERRIWNAIGKLSPDQEELVEMLIKDMPYSKIAHLLDCSENTLRGRIFRLRKGLRIAI